MELSEQPSKCITILFTNNQNDRQPQVRMKDQVFQSVKQTKLLGVMLDSRLTMKPHYENMKREGKRRVAQLCSAANSCFGPSQLSLREICTWLTCVDRPIDVQNEYKLFASTAKQSSRCNLRSPKIYKNSRFTSRS